VLVAAVGTFTYYQRQNQRQDQLTKLNEDYAQQKRRPIESRLSGTPYKEWIVNRGGPGPNDEEVDPLLVIMKGDAATVAELSGNDAKTLHARGLGLLLEGKESVDESLTPLRAAAAKEPDNVRYQADVAAALIAAGAHDATKLQLAVDASDRALQIDPRSLDALFNRALALQSLDRKQEAIAAYNRYLAVDPSSPWAGEVHHRLETLRFSLPPS
jgi:tetratricopeptide (TPR) repeat protein